MRDLAAVMGNDPTPGQVQFTTWLVVAIALITVIQAATVVVLVAAKRQARRVPPAVDIPTETLKEVA
jgi:hypothetical protein